MIAYEVINIYRTRENMPSFIIAALSDRLQYFLVSKSFTEKISRGFLYIGDFITITSQQADGIEFELAQISENSGFVEPTPLFYQSNFVIEPHRDLVESGVSKYLPFLCDVLPYSKHPVPVIQAQPIYKGEIFQGKYLIEAPEPYEVSNLRTQLPSKFIAKVHQKTRINVYSDSFNPFFFIIVSSNNILLKVVFWVESLKAYSSIKVGDAILVSSYKQKKKLPLIEKIELNTFTESAYFDVAEITAKEIAKVSISKGEVKTIFNTVKGVVSYLSVVMRHCINSSKQEYVLGVVGNKRVVLFYNSDDVFNEIRPGSEIILSEMRLLMRAGIEYYISTIYTQIEIQEEEEGKRAKRGGVFGAVGFLSDNFESMEDGSEEINGRKVGVNLFMRPHPTSVEELKKQTFVLNETKKFLIQGTVKTIQEGSLLVDYTEDGIPKGQSALTAVFEGGFSCYIFENFFEREWKAREIERFLNEKRCWVIEGLCVGDGVLYYITGSLDISVS